ncbi:DNA translocase FtsK [Cognatishimia sp. F0-27]|uniref:DNA translocase FtsK n=1 Tax=Cognatishimia sp. F0-27 TaxID=2816855 RepID=UPI001D0BF918|nr:DNA translocase FtsK [Cognatishimia sp. F0-27]MCC1491415.1 DNA translocase FtsK [Cognatishimia sp. F0-27]
MASYQSRGRDPLFDSETAVVLEKRGRELVGVVLAILGLMAAAMIWSYTPEDPSFLSATDAPVQNWMGRIGASIAAPLFMIVGQGAWAIAAVLLVWGVRLATHRSEGRVFGCMIFAPIWVALASVYAAGLSETAGWSHNFGLGGLFGDMMMGSLLNLLPVAPAFGLKLIQVVLSVVILGFGAFVLGFTRPELRAIFRFLVVGVVMSYATLMRLLGRTAGGAGALAAKMQAAQADRRAEKARLAQERAEWEAAQAAVPEPERAAAPAKRVRRAPMPAEPVLADEDDLEAETLFHEPPVEKTGLLARMPSLMRRPDPAADLPEPELVETTLLTDDMDGPGEDRVKARIADAVKSRLRASRAPVNPSKPVDPSKPLTKGRGFGPQPLILNARPSAAATRVEPPLTAGAAAAAASASTAAASAGIRPPVAVPVAGVDRAEAPLAHVAPDTEAPVAAEPARRVLARQPATEQKPVNPDTFREFDDYGDPEPEMEAENIFVEDPDADGVLDDAVILDDRAPAPPAEPAAILRGGQAAREQHPVPTPEAKRVVQQPARKALTPSRRAQAEAQPSLRFEDKAIDYELPPLNLLMSPDKVERHHLSDEALEENARMLESVLDDYGVKGEIVSVRPGPVVTMYELEPAPGLKASRVIGLADDIARSMSALSARVSTVPGRSVIGIELPNEKREMVSFREILSTRDYGDGNHKLPLALGKDIGGDPVVANLAKMPHLLIAGTTGSGKSVAINTMILSLLYKLTPEDCRLIMIDPKMLELSVYDGIPHLLSPVVTDPKKAVVALKWVVGEMEDRYRKMSKMGVRNIDGYNSRVADALGRDEMFERTVQTGFDEETGEPIFETEEFEPKKMPYIVVIVDEMADLMMVAGKEIEACIQRLAQMARASGIHLIMATQRPSVDVITGTIKANFPTRISFQVTSKIDSRTILGEMGAEQLLGMGDMLYMAGGAKITRCHGPFCSDEEVEEIVNHLKAFGPPEYVSGVVQGPDDEKADNIDAVLGLNTGGNTGGEDALYDQAVAIVIKDRKCSTSYIQRKLGIGYNKAARLVEQMEDEQVVSAANHVGKREILVPEQH